jgi:hypothetical protein
VTISDYMLHEVHVVVAGGPATGKTSLIQRAGPKDSAAPTVDTLPPLRIPGASLPDKVDAVLIDTSSLLVRTALARLSPRPCETLTTAGNVPLRRRTTRPRWRHAARRT